MLAVELRKHGPPPYRVAVVHGGPGAAGECGPLARTLGERRGVLEPIQTAKSVPAQRDELVSVITANGSLPVTLIGHSWGAWLSWIVAAERPDLVAKLILVGSGPFEAKYVANLSSDRETRLSTGERAEFATILTALRTAEGAERDRAFARMGALSERADSYDLLTAEDGATDDAFAGQFMIYNSVWPEAAQLRADGRLLNLFTRVVCPVVAIHGDHDSHPAEGVDEPLRKRMANFRMRLLEQCGHTPWRERQACDAFFAMLEEELNAVP